MKKILLLSLTLILLINCSCQGKKGETDITSMNEILSKADNNHFKTELVTRKYAIDSSGAEYSEMSLNELKNVFEIECIRKIGDGYYIAIEDDKEGWLYLSLKKANNDYIVNDFWHYRKAIYKSAFEELEIDVSTLDDVLTLDPFGYVMDSDLTGRLPSSAHETVDGYLVEIIYSNNIIQDIVFSTPDYALCTFVLPIDK